MKQRVLCLGPESSGTRLLTRLVGRLNVEAIHQSVPHGPDWWVEHENIDRAIVIVRDPFITAVSSVEAGHPTFWPEEESDFPYRITKAWEVMIGHLQALDIPWIPITYEGLVARPQWTMDHLAYWLDVPKKNIIEKVYDPRENIR